jgi:hypothetical protein
VGSSRRGDLVGEFVVCNGGRRRRRIRGGDDLCRAGTCTACMCL